MECTEWCKHVAKDYDCRNYGCEYHHDPACPNAERWDDDE